MQAKKKLCYTQKITQYSKSNTKIDQILALCLVTSYFQNSSITSVIINFGATDLFFCNQDLFVTYMEYGYKF